jgi:hypothetical protein
MTVQWKQPPKAKSRKWHAIVESLQANAGTWAFIGRINYSTGYKKARQHNLEIQVSNREGSKADVYLRATEEK